MEFRFPTNPSGNRLNEQVLIILRKARTGDVNQLEGYLRVNRLSIDLKNCNGSSALYLAAGYDLLTELTTLIEAGADVNISRSRFQIITPLMITSHIRESRCTQALVKAGAKHEKPNFLLKRGVRVNQRPSDSVPLIALVSSTQRLNALLAGTADIDETDSLGRTSLMITAENGNFETLNMLLQAKADPNKRDSNGKTALMYASDEDCIYSFLLQKGLQLYMAQYASTCGSDFPGLNDNVVKSVQVLLDAGADVNLLDHSGRTALMMAAKTGDTLIVTTLLQARADPNKQDGVGKTALMYVRNTTCMRILLSHGANMEIMDKSQCTVLIHWLQKMENADNAVCLLLNKGANPVINEANRSWLYKTLLSNPVNLRVGNVTLWETELVRLFVCNGIVGISLKDVNADSTSTVRSVLGCAVQQNQFDVIKYFLANCYLTQEDLMDMRDILSQEKDQNLDKALVLEDETQILLQQTLSQPWPLVKLAFIAVSSALGSSPDREERIPKTGLPDRLQRMLMFQEPVSRLPVSEWKDIPLTFDPVEYEKLPKPRPLLYYWPVGRDLVI